jgi:hypothetical protein
LAVPVRESIETNRIEGNPFRFVWSERTSVAEEHAVMLDLESVALAVDATLSVERPPFGRVKVEESEQRLVSR